MAVSAFAFPWRVQFLFNSDLLGQKETGKRWLSSLAGEEIEIWSSQSVHLNWRSNFVSLRKGVDGRAWFSRSRQVLRLHLKRSISAFNEPIHRYRQVTGLLKFLNQSEHFLEFRSFPLHGFRPFPGTCGNQLKLSAPIHLGTDYRPWRFQVTPSTTQNSSQPDQGLRFEYRQVQKTWANFFSCASIDLVSSPMVRSDLY